VLYYGRCPCGGEYDNREVTVRMTIGDEPVEFTNVSQGACPTCSSRVYKALELMAIEDVYSRMRESRQ